MKADTGASKKEEEKKPKRRRSASIAPLKGSHSKNPSVATGATQMTTQAMSPKNASNKGKNGSVKGKKAAQK